LFRPGKVRVERRVRRYAGWANGPFFLCGLQTVVTGRGTDKRELIALLEPMVESLGYELVDIDVRPGRNGLLRLFIDRDPPVTLGDCEMVSEQIGAFLDVEDPLPGSYVLEVSSPGADRRLRTRDHFERFVGSRIRVELATPREGRRRFTGVLNAVKDQSIGLEVDGRRVEIELGEVATARLVPGA
jgi:ribosome maturation factor RimP